MTFNIQNLQNWWKNKQTGNTPENIPIHCIIGLYFLCADRIKFVGYLLVTVDVNDILYL